MNKLLDKLCTELEKDVKRSYEEGVTMEEAERLAAKCLNVQLSLARAIRTEDIDSRMKRHGIKAVRASVYMAELEKHEKKPTETFLESVVNLDKLVETAERDYAEADAGKEELQNFFGVFKDAHIYFRGIAKGKFE